MKTLNLAQLYKYFAGDQLEDFHRFAVVDGTTLYGAGATEEEAMADFRTTCENAGIELGDYELVEIEAE